MQYLAHFKTRGCSLKRRDFFCSWPRFQLVPQLRGLEPRVQPIGELGLLGNNNLKLTVTNEKAPHMRGMSRIQGIAYALCSSMEAASISELFSARSYALIKA